MMMMMMMMMKMMMMVMMVMMTMRMTMTMTTMMMTTMMATMMILLTISYLSMSEPLLAKPLGPPVSAPDPDPFPRTPAAESCLLHALTLKPSRSESSSSWHTVTKLTQVSGKGTR